MIAPKDPVAREDPEAREDPVASKAPAATDPKPMVVLLHGFGAHRLLMSRIAASFRRAGHATLNWGYRSWFKPIEYHSERLAERLRQLDEDASVTRIDFVTHSMGCIVTRAALLKQLPKKHGRWVMLAPPNRGSIVANRFAPTVGWLLQPVKELQAKEDSYVNRLAVPSNIEIAVIQAKLDYIVSEPCTRIQEERDRFVVPGLHSAMLLRKDVARQALHFLEHGCFDASLKAAG